MQAYTQNTWNHGARCLGAYTVSEQTIETPQPKSRAVYSLFRGSMEWKFIPHFNNAYSPNTGEAHHFETRQELRDFYRDLLDDGFTTK